MSDDLSDVLEDCFYKIPDDAKPGDTIEFTIVSASREEFQDFKDKEKLNKRLVLRVQEYPGKVKTTKQGGERILAKYGTASTGLVGKKVRGIVNAMANGNMFLEFWPL